MKRLVELLDNIRKLDGFDMMRIERDDGYQRLEVIKDLERLFREFYDCGFDNGCREDVREIINPDVDFTNRLSNFYSYDRP